MIKGFRKSLSLIRNQDMFGHTINLNFDGEDDTHKTNIGGFFSLFIRFAIGVYVVYNFKKMIFNEEDKNFTENGILNLEELGEVPLEETHSLIFHRILN
jgi:hypothetical protein